MRHHTEREPVGRGGGHIPCGCHKAHRGDHGNRKLFRRDENSLCRRPVPGGRGRLGGAAGRPRRLHLLCSPGLLQHGVQRHPHHPHQFPDHPADQRVELRRKQRAHGPQLVRPAGGLERGVSGRPAPLPGRHRAGGVSRHHPGAASGYFGRSRRLYIHLYAGLPGRVQRIHPGYHPVHPGGGQAHSDRLERLGRTLAGDHRL